MKRLVLVGVVLIWAVIGLMLWRGNFGAWGWAEVVGLGATDGPGVTLDAIQVGSEW